MQGKFRMIVCAVMLLVSLTGVAGAINVTGYAGVDWARTYGGLKIDFTTSVQPTADGGYIVTGYTESNDGNVTGNHGVGYDFWVVKISPEGFLDFAKCFGGAGDEQAYSIQQTADTGYIVAGQTRSPDGGQVSGNHGLTDAWIVKLDSTGNLLWQRCLGGTNNDAANSILQTTDGGYIVAGGTASNDGDVSGNHGSTDVWIVKLDSWGAIVWQKCLGGSGVDGAASIRQTTDGGYIVAGTTGSHNGNVYGHHGGVADYWVIRLDSGGNLLWQRCLGGSGNDAATDARQTSDGGYIVSGYTESTDGQVSGSHGGVDYWVVKLDSAGNLTWEKCLGGSENDFGNSIEEAPDAGFVVAGMTGSTDGDVSGNHGSNDLWLVKLNSDGSLNWQRCLGGSGSDGALAIRRAADGGYIVAGESMSTDGDVSGNHGSADYWVVKLSPEMRADFTADRQTVTVNEWVNFYDRSQVPGGVEWNWSFGDGTYSTGQNTDHQYATTYSGDQIYDVTLTITDANGNKANMTKTQFIHLVAPPNPPGVSLSPGWNFISVNRTLATGCNNASIFAGVDTNGHSIWQYDAQNRAWRSMIPESPVRSLDAIWIYARDPIHVPLNYSTGWATEPPTKSLYKGWNAIGYTGTDPLPARLSLLSLGDKWTSVIGFDAATQQYTTPIIRGGAGTVSDDRTLVPKQAYWIYMTTNETLAMNV